MLLRVSFEDITSIKVSTGIWHPVPGEQLTLERENGNSHDTCRRIMHAQAHNKCGVKPSQCYVLNKKYALNEQRSTTSFHGMFSMP